MKHISLFQLDGKIPNLALMRIASHHRALGDDVEFRRGYSKTLFDQPSHTIYASTIFQKSAPAISRLLQDHPHAIIGGTGSHSTQTIEDIGITTPIPDYSLYPAFKQSLGFTQRGCRLNCSFCVVPSKEGAVRHQNTIPEIWRGPGHPKEILLLDNDFFGNPLWRSRASELRDGSFRVSFNQGINARFLSDEAAETIASLDYRDDSMSTRRIYTAWDNLKDEQRLFDGLNRLVKYGVKPDHIMVYILIGYWPGESHPDRDRRRLKLREFGARPYPMPFTRTPELVGFQRWVIGAYDKRIPWTDWASNSFRPEGLVSPQASTQDLFTDE